MQPLEWVEDPDAIADRVRSIESKGGGIFTRTALNAAVAELAKAEQKNRHIVLFADAADSEEQGGCLELVTELRARKVTLSVIALGTDADSDAAFLRQLAQVGGGESYFTTDPSELPRLFAMDTLAVSRAAFVEEPASVQVLPDLLGLTSVPTETFPSLAGYNLTYARASAQLGIATTDDYKAPVFAFMQQGLGRTAAYAGQIGGTFGGDVLAWEGFAPMFVTICRWLVGQEEPTEFFPTVRREGSQAVLSVEVDTERAGTTDVGDLAAIINRPGGGRRELELQKVEPGLFEARVPLDREGVGVATIRVGEDRFVSLPPIVRAYSPEFERSPDPGRGERVLRQIARESSGEKGVTAPQLFRGSREGRSWRLVSRELALLALLILLVEIACRRLALFSSRRPRRPRAQREKARPQPEDSTSASRRDRPAEPTAGQVADQDAGPAAAPEPQLGSALSRARRAADRKLGR